MDDFLKPQTVAALGAFEHIYTRRFTIGAATAGTPSTQGSDSIAIQGSIHFFTERLFLAYPTVEDVDTQLTDDYVPRLTLTLKAGSVVALTSGPVNVALLGVPGRQPVAGALDPAGGVPAPGFPLHVDGFAFRSFLAQGTPFVHLFENSSNAQAVVDVAWRGWNIPQGKCPDAAHFWRVVRECQAPPMGR